MGRFGKMRCAPKKKRLDESEPRVEITSPFSGESFLQFQTGSRRIIALAIGIRIQNSFLKCISCGTHPGKWSELSLGTAVYLFSMTATPSRDEFSSLLSV